MTTPRDKKQSSNYGFTSILRRLGATFSKAWKAIGSSMRRAIKNKMEILKVLKVNVRSCLRTFLSTTAQGLRKAWLLLWPKQRLRKADLVVSNVYPAIQERFLGMFPPRTLWQINMSFWERRCSFPSLTTPSWLFRRFLVPHLSCDLNVLQRCLSSSNAMMPSVTPRLASVSTCFPIQDEMLKLICVPDTHVSTPVLPCNKDEVMRNETEPIGSRRKRGTQDQKEREGSPVSRASWFFQTLLARELLLRVERASKMSIKENATLVKYSDLSSHPQPSRECDVAGSGPHEKPKRMRKKRRMRRKRQKRKKGRMKKKRRMRMKRRMRKKRQLRKKRNENGKK